MNPRSNASAKPVPDPARNEFPSFLQETNCPPRSPTAPEISGEAGYQHGTFSMSSSELQADDSEEGGRCGGQWRHPSRHHHLYVLASDWKGGRVRGR